MLLVDPKSGAEVLSFMNITNISVSSDRVSLDVNLPNNLKIFEDVKAVADGSFWVHVYQQKEYVGSTRMTLPDEGLSGGRHTLRARTSLDLKGNADISVDLEPAALCLMEQYSR